MKTRKLINTPMVGRKLAPEVRKLFGEEVVSVIVPVEKAEIFKAFCMSNGLIVDES